MKTSVKVTQKRMSLHLLITHAGGRRWQSTGLKVTGVKSKDAQIWRLAEQQARQLEAELLLNREVTVLSKTDFLEYMKEQISYRREKKRAQSIYNKILKYCQEQKIKRLLFHQVNEKFVAGFHEWCRERGNAENTLTVELLFIKSILNKAIAEKLITSHNLRLVKKKREETHKEFLTLKEVDTMMKLNVMRNNIVNAFLLSCFTGLRYSDLEQLKQGNVTFEGENAYITVVQQKTKSMNRIPVPVQALGLLARGASEGPDALIFPELAVSSTVSVALRSFLLAAGITKKITFHSARHTYAMAVYAATSDLYVTQQLLGHTDIKTTQIYAKMSDKRKLEAVHQLQEQIYQKGEKA